MKRASTYSICPALETPSPTPNSQLPTPYSRFPSRYWLSSPCGISIAEVIIATSVLSVLATTGVTVVLLLMTAEQRAAESVLVERTIADLGDELRRDAHAAAAAELAGEARVVLTGEAGERVSYECTGDGVWRREESGESPVRREKFHLPFGASRFELVEGGRLVVWRHEREVPVTMSLAEPTVGTDPPRRVFRIDAAVGLRRGLTVAAH